MAVTARDDPARPRSRPQELRRDPRHGREPRLTLGLAVAFIHLAHITGLSSEESLLLQVDRGDLSLEGLVLAGMVIGALGVLDDVTVSQSSAVLALRRANPAH
jgi:uncharacterized membrane protein